MVNPKYKDRLFCLLFGNLDYKENIISLYNALCDTNYDYMDEMQLYTIDDVIYIKMKNDVSVLIDSYLSLWEHQSTFNPNMPVRGLMYYGKMYSRYITDNALNLYGKRLIQIPTPKYTVFYNGAEDIPDIVDLKLSDSFIKTDKSGNFEWTAHMINLNKGKNDELLEKCRVLGDYMELVNKIKINQTHMKFEDAVNKAVDECIENDILRSFLTKHKAEVMDVCITEFNEKSFVDGIKEEGRAEGRAEGMTKGIAKGKADLVVNMYNNGLNVDQISKFTEVDVGTVKKWLESHMVSG